MFHSEHVKGLLHATARAISGGCLGGLIESDRPFIVAACLPSACLTGLHTHMPSYMNFPRIVC